jgi:putative protease
MAELCKVSHRPYSTGFYLGKPTENDQVYTDSSYVRDYDLIGIVLDYDEKTKIATVSQRNRFFTGDEIEVMQPGKPFFTQTVEYMENESRERIDAAPHAAMLLRMPMAQPVCKDAMLRKKR